MKNAANNDIVVLDVANYLRFFAASESKEVFITDMDQENKEEKRAFRKAIMLCIWFVFLWVGFPILFVIFFNNPYIVVGTIGYVRHVILSFMLIFYGIICIYSSSRPDRPAQNQDEQETEPDKPSSNSKGKRIVFLTIAIISFVFAGWRLIKDFRDIPYLNNPQEVVLSDLKFSDSIHDRHNAIDRIWGYDESGKFRNFNISQRMMKEARKLPLDYTGEVTDDRIKARICYLPNTKVLYKLEYYIE